MDSGTYEEKPARKKKAFTPEMTDTERDNIAAFMDEERLKVIGNKGLERYERDLVSRGPRMQKLEELQKMYALVAEEKSFPWHKCANIKTPALTGPNLQIQARLFDMIWPASGKIFHAMAATAAELGNMHKAEEFANWYVRTKMAYMPQGLDDTLHQMTLYGSSFRRTYWDAYEAKVRSDWIPIEDFVVAYSERSQDPSMSNVGRYTLVNRISTYDLDARAESGYYINVDEAKKVKCDEDGNRSKFADTADKIDGVTRDNSEDDDEGGVRKVLEQHCRWKLPNDPKTHPSFDGKEHYVMVAIDRASKKVLGMWLREEDDPDDVRRYEREKAKVEAEWKAQAEAMMAPQQPTMTEPPMPGAMDMAQPPMPGPMDSTMPGAPPPAAPPPPLPGEAPGASFTVIPPTPMVIPPLDPSLLPPKARKRQICFFTHYRCFPSDGFYGLGYGDLLYGIAVAQNTVINQWVDGQAVKNARPMFMSRQIRMQRGTMNIGPGSVNEIDAPVASIKDAIHFLDPPNSDPGTVPLIKMLDGFTDRIAGNGDLMSGQAPGSNQTKAGMQILNEQMMAPITVLARRVKEAFKHELDKIWRCWGVFLEDEDVVDIVGEGGQPAQVAIGRAMFTPSARLVPASDPRMKSQRIEDLQALTAFISQSPLMQNPQIMVPVMTKLAEMVLRVMPDGEQLIPLLQPPPPPPPMPKSQIEENAGFLEGKDSPVLPPDNDDEHLFELQKFMMSPEHGALEPKGQQAVMQHLRNHLAQKMKKGSMNGGPGGFPGGPMGGGPPVMEGPPPFAPPPGAPPA